MKLFARNPERAAYAGFWRRAAALVLDSLLYLGLSLPWLLYLTGGTDDGATWQVILIDHVVPAILIIACWLAFRGTPGKLLMDCYLVDAKSRRPVSFFQALLRYLGYFVSLLTLGLGYLWVAWHPRRQGFHDLIAKTVVLHDDDDLSSRSLEELARPFS